MMTPTPIFSSSLAQAMTDLVTFKRIQGADYTGSAVALGYLDRFLCRQGYREARLNQQIVDAYVAHTAHLARNTRWSRLSCVRVFSRFLNHLDPKSYVLAELPVSRPSLPRWYLFSDKDVVALLRHAEALGPAGSLRPHCIRMLVGLLWMTGLRISEALALNLGDLDTERRLLLVRKGKLRKERYVALHPTAIGPVQEYLVKRANYGPSSDCCPFFLHSSGKRLEYEHAKYAFRQLVRLCSIGQDAPKPPRLHDLRHTYACNCVLRWYDEGVNVNSMLPVLATALGHVDVQATQIYLHVSSRLLHQGAQRFHPTFTATCKRSTIP